MINLLKQNEIRTTTHNTCAPWMCKHSCLVVLRWLPMNIKICSLKSN